MSYARLKCTCFHDAFKALSFGKLSGTIPAELGQLGAPSTLYLSNSKLLGATFAELGQLGALDSLCLDQNELAGAIPEELGQLGALTTSTWTPRALRANLQVSSELDLGGNQIHPDCVLDL